MGRYTSVQSFSDQNTKVVGGYKETGEPSGKSDGKTSAAAPPAKLVTEKIQVIMGSCAGAGSGEFDVYRAARRRERMRLEAIETEQRAQVEVEVFTSKVERNQLEAAQRTAKNSEARKRKKEKQKLKQEEAKKRRAEGKSECGEEKSDSAGEEEKDDGSSN